MEFLLFALLGIVVGIACALLLLQFSTEWVKGVTLGAGAPIIILMLVTTADYAGISSEYRLGSYSAFLAAWIVTFLMALRVAAQSIKRNEDRYKINIWQILFSNKKMLDDYYGIKKQEIESAIQRDLQVEKLEERKEILDQKEKQIRNELDAIEAEKQALAKAISEKHTLSIPKRYQFVITPHFFEVLPRYIKTLSTFSIHARSLTDDFLKAEDDSSNQERIVRSYLYGLCTYIGKSLFQWRDVRVHVRRLDRSTNTYVKYVAVCDESDYTEKMTPIPADDGLICEATKTCRSLVYSANRECCFTTRSEHLWKDYITMIFESFQIDRKPMLTMGISVRNQADHRELLYLLSYIQFEQTVQDLLKELNARFPIVDILGQGAKT